MVKNIDMLGVSDEDVIALFNNIEEIRDFNEYVIVCVICLSVHIYVHTHIYMCICALYMLCVHYVCM